MNTQITTPIVTSPVQLKVRAYIVQVEAELTLLKSDQISIEEDHKFTSGLYIRSVFLPKGTFLVGKIHKTEHANLLSKGDVSVLTEFGPARYEAGASFISPAWTKRLVYAHEDSIWTVFHPTTLTDLKEIEELVIAKDYSELNKLEVYNEIQIEDIEV